TAEPLWVVPGGDQQGGGVVRADTHPLQQLGPVCVDDGGQSVIQFADLLAQPADAVGQQGQGVAGDAGGIGTQIGTQIAISGGQFRAAAEQDRGAQPGQRVPQSCV